MRPEAAGVQRDHAPGVANVSDPGPGAISRVPGGREEHKYDEKDLRGKLPNRRKLIETALCCENLGLSLRAGNGREEFRRLSRHDAFHLHRKLCQN